ncbi:ABC transporter ATP-binding protein [Phormidium tenue]|uniref:Sugar ABC transporter ATP-binding protein n=1 Tax=Phormidium tenue NIES-30 TaxID=549789 RepID=A0A1U7J4S7_9CYAN|nr:ABC transporter ATP-binding protein [Phormidium tenue]MBD2232566.1 ABC transporter ATP-binding protein [Phormidium tenue FACHB-1052]OKH47702.1 sugar ABC transporter ATP-binding protein [Phormidium tenue NIES-30]
MAQVAIENVYKTFPKSRQVHEAETALEADHDTAAVLKRINLTVEDGEFMVLVGPSGCGKSTLLRLISGLEAITGGSIWVGDRKVNDLPPKQRDTAMVFQSYALYPHLTVYDNLAFGLRRMGADLEQSLPSLESGKQLSPSDSPANQELERLLTESRWWEKPLVSITRRLPLNLRYVSEAERLIDERVRSVAKMLQIDGLLNRQPRQLSGGQKQRVALGRAMARNPQVFLMDEPLSNLDAKLRMETRAQIVNLQRQLGITTIYVTHDQVEAMTMGHRIAVMNLGQIQQVATPLELYNRPANRFVAGFIGSPPMNVMPVQVQAPFLLVHPEFRLSLPSSWDDRLLPYDNREALLGIRPEHLSLALPAPKNIRGHITHMEALGSETYLTVQTEALTLLAKIPPDEVVRIGDEVWLAIAAEKAHLFDPESEVSLWSR